MSSLQEMFKDMTPGKVVDFDPASDKLLQLDFTAANSELTDEILTDTVLFSNWIDGKLAESGAKYGIGGYNEHRTIYSRSRHFDSSSAGEEPRRLHLGTDIWGPAGTAVYSFADAEVYGFADNNNFGDYGATIILKYTLQDHVLYGLYGHLSTSSIEGLYTGKPVKKGEKFAEFGIKEENGWWPPHLHFQLMLDMEGNTTDYPGVCRYSERNKYLGNCPDPMLVLNYTLKSNCKLP